MALDRGKNQKRVETMANKFASALLMPRETLAENFEGAIDAGWLNRTATVLGVTSSALKWRLVSLDLIDADTARAFDERLLRNNGMPSGHRDDPPPRFSKVFMRVIGAAIDKWQISVRRAARLLDVNTDEVIEIFDDHGIARPFDL